MKHNKIMLFVALLCIVFAVLNMLDLHYTLAYIEYEINPLVLSNFPVFYMMKYIVSCMLATTGIYVLVDRYER
jgi:hypothetical protein